MSQELLSRKSSSKFHIFSIAIFTAFLGLYISLSFSSFAHVQLNRYFYLVLCIIMSVLYIWNYRRNSLFCYETIFFSLFILCIFFADIVLDNLGLDVRISSVYYASFSADVENKGMIVQMLGFFGFMSAASLNNYRNDKSEHISSEMTFTPQYININYKSASTIMSVLTAVYIIYIYFSGVITSWFHYSGDVASYTNTEIVYCTTLCLVLSVVEFTSLNIQGCHSFIQFIKTCNKLCLFDILSLSIILLISGNRNECLLILLPAVVGYSVFIKKITNLQFLTGLVVGLGLMIFIGVIRVLNYSITNDMDIGLFESTRDFGFVSPNTRYLIDYVDKNNPIYFNNAFLNLMSAVPLLGGFIASFLDLSFDTRSTLLTTDGLQLSSNSSGIGTSLVGDLYYTGAIWMVILFFLWFGWFVSSMHNRFVIKKIYNPWLLIFYAFNFANVVYFIRAEWTMPFRYLGFSCLIFFIMSSISKIRI